MPHISQTEYQSRRQKLMAQLEGNSLVLLPAATLCTRNRDSEYPFRQHSDFHYLTGFPEPDALLVLLPDGQGGGRAVLFCLPKDRDMEIWTGYRCGAEKAVSEYRMDEAYTLDDLDEQMLRLLQDRQQVYLPLSEAHPLQDQLQDWRQSLQRTLRNAERVPQRLANIDPLLHEMRLIKSEAEQAMMRAAAELSADGHIRAMRGCKPGMTEYQLEAEIQHCFAMQGARWPAYSSIVGSGANACVLHYTENSDTLNPGDLVLIDAGAELDCYAGDITRTFPAGGRFTEDQKALYEIVLEAQEAAIEASRPGNHFNHPHEAALRVLTAGLVKLGLLQGELEQLIEEAAYRPFYMHRTSHWLGLDVHDVGAYREGEDWRTLEPGMVLTIEPGLYIAPDNEQVDARWRGIGIRIEDDVLVTASGCEVLSRKAPKRIEDIEALMS